MKGFTPEFRELLTSLHERYRNELSSLIGENLKVKLDPDCVEAKPITAEDFLRLDKIVSEFKLDKRASIRGSQVVTEDGTVVIHQHFNYPLNMLKGDSVTITINLKWPWS